MVLIMKMESGSADADPGRFTAWGASSPRGLFIPESLIPSLQAEGQDLSHHKAGNSLLLYFSCFMFFAVFAKTLKVMHLLLM